MATKKASPAQLAARKLFAERAKAGAFTKRATKKVARKINPTKRAKDARYTITKTATGTAKPQYVVWFQGEWTGAQSPTKAGAEAKRAELIADGWHLKPKTNPRMRQTMQAAPAKRKTNPRMRQTMQGKDSSMKRMMNPISPYKYVVEAELPAGRGAKKWRGEAAFRFYETAVQYAEMLAKAHPAIAIRVTS